MIHFGATQDRCKSNVKCEVLRLTYFDRRRLQKRDIELLATQGLNYEC